ncbi:MAG: sulfotransferase domain-containing protein [Victivallaceae bacterium]|nr:sulfotransferase domain-containing protein [Victivallaceae bacterium]
MTTETNSKDSLTADYPFDPNETILADFSLFGRLRRRLLALFYTLPDRGLFGMTPLEYHIHICGYSRAGTTLLQIMLEFAYPESRHFGREISGRWAAIRAKRNHKMMISKKPKDIFRLHQLINFYKDRQAALKPIILIRDPRDVLTSSHVITTDRPYHVPIERWQHEQPFIRYYMNDPDVLLIRYEDLTSDTAKTQQQIEEFIGEKSKRNFADFYKEQRDDFDTRHLNGVRPVDSNTIARWQRPEHAERIKEILREAPELLDELIAIGYETDKSWAQKYQL